MSEDKRTKYGTGAAATPRPATGPVPIAGVTATPRPATGPVTGASPSQATAILQPSDPLPTPAPLQTPAPVTAYSTPATSYLPQQGDPMLGSTLAGRYAITKKLGEGGMGAVYLATHTLLDKQVALKVLHGEFARKPDLVERFMQEAKAASRIRHENVIDISDFGTTPEGMVFFAMELLKGHDLHEEVARARLNGQLLPWQRSKKIFLQICAALSAAHKHGIVHRDLKPENIYLIDFLGEPDFVKLLDFGIAKQTEVEEGGRKLTKTGMLFGTPEYMSPEQARGEQVDHRVDVYAMGCILFQLVTGRVPFEADNFMSVLTLHLTEPPPMIPPEVFDMIGAPREIAGVIDRALQKDKSMRWATIDELANGVRRVCGDPIPTGSISATGSGPAQSTHAMVAAPATTTTQRQRTQWTGSVQVPAQDTEVVQGGGSSKLPYILGGILVVAAAGVGAFFAFGRGGGSEPPGPGTASGSNPIAVVADAGPGSATVLPPDAAPEVVLPPLPDKVEIKIVSKPAGAEVKNLTKGTVYGKTPVTLKVPGSRDVVSFAVTLKGYGDVIVDITPDKSYQELVTLEKGESGSAPKRIVGGTTPDTGSGAVTRPDTGSAKPPDVKPPDVKPPDVKPPEVKPPDVKPPVDDCKDEDMPCLKSPFPAKGSGEAAL